MAIINFEMNYEPRVASFGPITWYPKVPARREVQAYIDI